MSRPQFTEQAWDEFLYWHNQDRKTVKKINKLISDIIRNGPLNGIGKPEKLQGAFSGYYSRRINDKDRLVYQMLDDNIVLILSCRGHYEDK